MKFKRKIDSRTLFVIGLLAALALIAGYVILQITLFVPAIYKLVAPLYQLSFGIIDILYWGDGKVLFLLIVSGIIFYFEIMGYLLVKRRR